MMEIELLFRVWLGQMFVPNYGNYYIVCIHMYYYILYVVHYLCIVVCYTEMTMKSGLFNELLIIVPKLVCIQYLNRK